MRNISSKTTRLLAYSIVALFASWADSAQAQGLTLTGTEQLTLDGSYGYQKYVYVYDQSQLTLATGANFFDVQAYDTSTVNITGVVSGEIVFALNSATVNVFSNCGAEVVAGASNSDGGTVNVNSGTVFLVDAGGMGSGTVNINYGGTASICDVDSGGTVIVNGSDFELGEGLSLDGNQLLGTGNLTYNYADGMSTTTAIESNDPGGRIILSGAPEPGSPALLALGATALLGWRRRNRQS